MKRFVSEETMVFIGEEAKFSFIVWPRKGHWEGESGRYLLPGLPGLCALLPPIETPKKRTTTSTRFSQYYVVRTREPAPFWRENVIAVASVAIRRILGDPGAVSRVGRKGATKVFKYGRKSPWVPTLTALFPKLQADAGSWLGTKNALYYCAQSANSFSWVLFVSSYTTAIVWITACLAHAPKKCSQSNFQFDIKSPSDFKILSARKPKTLFQKYN